MPANDRAYKAARRQRRQMSLPEVLLWQRLRRNPCGISFRRQHPIGPYVLDFYCPAARLAIEIDGIAHDMGDRPERDEVRNSWLAEQGLQVVHIEAREVLRDPDAVAEMLVRAAQNPSTIRSADGPPPHSLRERRGSG
jgi:very-short-patch-repair endonuclease